MNAGCRGLWWPRGEIWLVQPTKHCWAFVLTHFFSSLYIINNGLERNTAQFNQPYAILG